MQGSAAAEAEPEAESCGAAEVWLRGNPRPAVVVLAAMVSVATAAAGFVAGCRPPAWGVAAVATACAAGLAAAAAFVWAAARPRLVRRGGMLEVRLSPMGVQRVPLDVVECVFPGSQPLGADADEIAHRRVSTLVLRLAERAEDWRSRPVAKAWGSWEDGNVVFDGRWCEPLSPAVAREISARLLDARRRLGPTQP